MTIILLAFAVLAFSFVLFKASVELVHAIRILGKNSPLHTFFFMALAVLAATVIPELSVAFSAVSLNMPQFALGSALGANVALMGLVIPLAVLSSGLIIRVERAHFSRQSILLMLVSAALPFLLLYDGMLSRFDGVVLLFLFVLYALFIFGKRYVGEYGITHVLHHEKGLNPHKERQYAWFSLIFSLIILLIGSLFFVEIAALLTIFLKIDPYLSAFFIVGPALVLPSIILAVVAAREKELVVLYSDVFGALVANATIVTGLIALIAAPSMGKSTLYYDWSFIMLMCVGALLVFFSFSKNKLVRWEAGVLLAAYAFFFFLMSFM